MEIQQPTEKQQTIFGLKLSRIAMILFAAAFVFRLIYLIQIDSMPISQYPILDEAYNLQLVEQINSTEGMPDEPYFRAPLYPYILSFVYKITGNSLFSARLIQIFFGSFLPVLVFLLGFRLFNKTVAFIAGIVAVFYPTFVFYDTSFLITSLMVLLTTLLVLQLYRTQEKPDIKSFVITGAILGLAAITSSNILFLAPVLFIWIWIIIRSAIGTKKAIISYAAAAVACLVIILPVTIRNYSVSNDLVFISWQGGFNFYLGNHSEANGWSAAMPEIDASMTGGLDESVRIAQMEAKQLLKKSEVSSYWYSRAWDDIGADPVKFVKRLFTKMRLLINGYEIPNIQNIYSVRDNVTVMKPLLFNAGVYFPYGVLVPLALIGIGISVRHWRKYLLLYIFLASYGAVLVFYYVYAQVRQPLIPVLILFAVYAVYMIVKYIRTMNWKPLVLIIPLVILLGMETNRYQLDITENLLDSTNHYTLGNAYRNQGNLEQAEAEYKLAYQIDPSNVYAVINVGCMLRDQREFDKAINCFREAVAVNPLVYNAYTNWANILLEQEKYQEVIDLIEPALEKIPQNDKLHFKKASALFRLKKYDEAIKVLETCLRINPQNTAYVRAYRQILAEMNK